jgi:hypothetical protein
MPKIEEFIISKGKIKVLEIIKDGFNGIELQTLIKAIKFGKSHLKDFNRCAVVTDQGWIGPITRLASSVFHIKIKTFPAKKEEEARAWLKE